MRARVGDDAKARGQGRRRDAQRRRPRVRADEIAPTAAASFGSTSNRLGPAHEIRQDAPAARAHAGRALDRVGEFGGMRGGERDHRRTGRIGRARAAPRRRRPRCADRSMTPLRDRRAPFPRRTPPRRRARRRNRAGCARAPARIANSPDCVELAHQRAHRVRVAAIGLEQQALEIGGDLDVHRRRLRRLDAARLVDAARQRARENVVLVGGDDQPLDRQAHPLGVIARENVAEIAGRHGERYAPRPARRARPRR